ncbi:hypothetical protein OPV22_020253 [Ensete ventricosum]|uniref:Uncharacterized protein n=1 Tax=Ensete ventricosum TaxID=4639 RepID=A0AAV8P9N8_ENSVE|nr:hypothetical protein OPV22_020253 [Ensete ventricosum]
MAETFVTEFARNAYSDEIKHLQPPRQAEQQQQLRPPLGRSNPLPPPQHQVQLQAWGPHQDVRCDDHAICTPTYDNTRPLDAISAISLTRPKSHLHFHRASFQRITRRQVFAQSVDYLKAKDLK